jgi:hypothetical protein
MKGLDNPLPPIKVWACPTSGAYNPSLPNSTKGQHNEHNSAGCPIFRVFCERWDSTNLNRLDFESVEKHLLDPKLFR